MVLGLPTKIIKDRIWFHCDVFAPPTKPKGQGKAIQEGEEDDEARNSSKCPRSHRPPFFVNSLSSKAVLNASQETSSNDEVGHAAYSFGPMTA